MHPGTWYVHVQGWTPDLEHLARHFAHTAVRVTKDDRGADYLYESDSFASCVTPEAVLALAEEELRVLSGVLKLFRGSPQPLRPGAVCRINAQGGRDAFVRIIESAHAIAEAGLISVSVTDSSRNLVQVPIPPPRTIGAAVLALRDEAVAKAMRLHAAPDYNSWVGLYRVHEVIEADVGGEHQLRRRAWGSPADLKRFKHSANSVHVGGDSSRHGKEIDRPPKNPMNIDEAAAYLNYVLQSWLTAKGV